MKRILVVNEGFSSNLGDQAIKESVLNVLRSFGTHADFANYSVPSLNQVMENGVSALKTDEIHTDPVVPGKAMLGMPRRTAGHLKWYVTNGREIKRILKNGHYDVIIIGGGQLINSSEKVRFNIFSLALYCWVRFARKYTKAKVYLMGVGAVNHFHRAESFFYTRALKLIDGIWVRDQYSAESLKKNFNTNSRLMPDFAFYDPATYNKVHEKEDLAIVGIYSFHEILVKFHKDGLTREKYYTVWLETIRRYQREGLQVKLFYTTFSDAKETILFRNFLQKDHQLSLEIAQTGTLDALSELYRKVKKIYSARMHALILGMKYQCQVEAYPVTKKLETFDKEYIRSGKSPDTYSNEIRSVIAEVLGK